LHITFLDDVCCGTPTPFIPSWAPGLFSTVKLKVYTYGEICTVLSDPSGYSVIPIPYQNHGESFTECSLLESAHFSFEPTDCETGFASPHLLETHDLSQLILVTISPVFGMQTADDSLVSRDDETASGDKNLDICPTLVNFIATLEQQFITIDDLLDEEDVDPFMDDEIELVMTVLINEASKSHMSSVYGLIVARLPTSLDDSQEMSDNDTISSLFSEVVEFVMDLGVELEDSITDMLAIDSDDHPVASMNLQVIMGSNDPSNQSKQTLNCLPLMTTLDASATVLPYDRGPVKVLTISTGSLKSLPFDHGTVSPFLSVLLKAVPRLVFEVMKACCFLHLEFISYFVLVLRAIVAAAGSLLAWTRPPQDFRRKPTNHPNVLTKNVF
jgi:hypothetical protein